MASDLEVFLQALVQPASNQTPQSIILAALSSDNIATDTDAVTTNQQLSMIWGHFTWGTTQWGR